MIRRQNTLAGTNGERASIDHGRPQKTSSQLDIRNSVGDLQTRLMNTQTEAAAISALSFVHSKAAAKDTRGQAAHLFTDPSIPDLIFGICRRFQACISFVSSVLVLCSDVPDFGKKALRNRTVVAFLRFLTSNESLANAFEQVIGSHLPALKAFASSEGEKVLTDVMSQLRGRARPMTIASLLRLVAKLVTEPPNSTLERNNLLSSFLLLTIDADVLAVLADGCKAGSDGFIESLLSILKAAGVVDTMVIPVEFISLMVKLLIEDGCKGAAEEARVPDWDSICVRLVNILTSFPTTDARRASPFVAAMWVAAADNAPSLSSSLCASLLQCAIQYMHKGWILPAVIHIANASFSHKPVLLEQRFGIIVLLHSCAFKAVHRVLATLNIPAIRSVFKLYVTDADVTTMGADEKLICEFWISFVHLATYLRLAPVEELFAPLSVHIASGKIKERSFQELTRWPRNDANDERRLAMCKLELEAMAALEAEEAIARSEFNVVFQDIDKFYVDFKLILTELEKDIRFIRKFRAWRLAVEDDKGLLDGKKAVVENIKADLISSHYTKVDDLQKYFKVNMDAEIQSHKAEIDGIVWDADEMATKVVGHNNKLAQIESTFDKESREVTAISQWRLGICDQVLSSLQKIEFGRSVRLLNLEKEEERLRGVVVLSSPQWADIVHDHEEHKENLVKQEATARSQLWLHPAALAIEQHMINIQKIIDFGQLHSEYTIEIEEERGRELVNLSRQFFLERPDLPQLAASYGLTLSRGSRSPNTRSPTSRSPANKSLSPQIAAIGEGFTSNKSPPFQSMQIVTNGRQSPFPQDRSPALTPRTSQVVAQSEVQFRGQIVDRELEWRRYYLETCDVERRKAYYQERCDEVQLLQHEGLEEIDRLRIQREWTTGIPISVPTNQQKQMGRVEPKLGIPSNTFLNSVPPSLFVGPMPATSPVGTAAPFTSNAASAISITSQEIASQRDHRSVIGCIRKTSIKYRSNEVQDMEAHRRLRIIYLYRIFANEMHAQFTQLQFKTRIQWACMDDESFSRYQLACTEQSAFQRIQELKAFEERFTVPLRHIHEIERQVRSQIAIDERIDLQQLLVNRPRGKRFRPMREIETDHVRTSAEPGLAPRVKGWLKNTIAHNPMPIFAEIYPSIAFVLTTDLKPQVTAVKSNQTAENSAINLADGSRENSDLHGSLKGPITVTQTVNETSTLVAPSFSSTSPSGANYRSSEVSNNLTVSVQATVVASTAPSFDVVSTSLSMVPVVQQIIPSGAVNPASSAASPNSGPSSHFASKLRDEIKVERKSVFLLRALQKLETARREEVLRCEETARQTFSYQFSKAAAYRLVEEKEAATYTPQKMRRKDSINRKYAK